MYVKLYKTDAVRVHLGYTGKPINIYQIVSKSKDSLLYINNDVQVISKSDEFRVGYFGVLTPEMFDKQKDIVSAYEIRKNAYYFIGDTACELDIEHQIDITDVVAKVVASDIYEEDRAVIPGQLVTKALRPGDFEYETEGVTIITKGTWYIGIQFNEVTWTSVQDGTITGVSIFGGALRSPEPVTV